MGFGQHQSFYLRSNWITMALENLNDEDFFSEKSNYLRLGIGKNMFSSLRHWMVATGVAEKKKKGALGLSPLGKIIKEYDVNCLQKDTKSILHYNLCADSGRAETWYWFFNLLNGKKFIKDDLFENKLKVWVNEQGKTIVDNTLRKDLDCLIQVYTNSENLDDPEDTVYSPLASLGILTTSTNEDLIIIQKNEMSIDSVGEGALMYSLLRYLEDSGTTNTSIDDLLTKENLWGRVFNMNKQAIYEALNTLSLNSDNKLTFTRTNNLDTVNCDYGDPISYLDNFYRKKIGA